MICLLSLSQVTESRQHLKYSNTDFIFAVEYVNLLNKKVIFNLTCFRDVFQTGEHMLNISSLYHNAFEFSSVIGQKVLIYLL